MNYRLISSKSLEEAFEGIRSVCVIKSAYSLSLAVTAQSTTLPDMQEYGASMPMGYKMYYVPLSRFSPFTVGYVFNNYQYRCIRIHTKQAEGEYMTFSRAIINRRKVNDYYC